jgi:amino acid transporter
MSKTKAIANDIVGNTNTQRTIFKILAISLVVLSIIYIYMIGSITFNVVARKSLEKTSQGLNSSISNLELTYLNNMNNINKAHAMALGYVDTTSNIFAVRSINHVAIR